MARQLVQVAEGVLDEWKRRDCEKEFLAAVLAGLEELERDNENVSGMA